MDKLIEVSTRFRWKIIVFKPGNRDVLKAKCERLGLEVTALSYDQLTIAMNDAMCALFKKVWDEGKWNQYSFDHSIEFRVDDALQYLDIVPNPVRVK